MKLSHEELDREFFKGWSSVNCYPYHTDKNVITFCENVIRKLLHLKSIVVSLVKTIRPSDPLSI